MPQPDTEIRQALQDILEQFKALSERVYLLETYLAEHLEYQQEVHRQHIAELEAARGIPF